MPGLNTAAPGVPLVIPELIPRTLDADVLPVTRTEATTAAALNISGSPYGGRFHAENTLSPYEANNLFSPIDLTVSGDAALEGLPHLERYWRTRAVRRLQPTEAEKNIQLKSSGVSKDVINTFSDVKDFNLITGHRYVFRRFVHDFPIAALCVWIIFFLLELTLVILYIVQTTMSYDVTWKSYDLAEHSAWFYSNSIIAMILMLQLVFAYSLSYVTLFVVVTTGLYQIVLFIVSFCPGYAWVSRMYVPFFLRCWAVRQYLEFSLDTFALMSTTADYRRTLDLIRLSSGTLMLFACMVFTFSCFWRIDQTFQGYPRNLGVAIYYVVYTVTTVGYGDVTSDNDDGRAISLVLILTFVTQMPIFIQTFRSTVKIVRTLRTYKGRPNHFIVYGKLTREEAKCMLDELFFLYPMKSICFCSTEIPADVQSLSHHPTYRLRCEFFVEENLDALVMRRLKAHLAAGVIILPTLAGYSSRVDDEVMMASMLFQRLLPELPQYVWLRYGLHCKLLRGHRAMIVDEHIKKNIMASSLLLPGIVPFLVNIVRTGKAGGTEPPNLWSPEAIHDWRGQYEYSRRNVTSCCVVPPNLVGMTMRDLIVAFKQYDVLIVGVEDHSTKTMLLDLSYRVKELDVLATIYERTRDSLAKVLEHFYDGEPLHPIPHESAHYGRNRPQFGAGPSETDTGHVQRSFSSTSNRPPGAASTTEDLELEAAAKAQLLRLPFISRTPRGVPVEHLYMTRNEALQVASIVRQYEETALQPLAHDEERAERLATLQGELNGLVVHLAGVYLEANGSKSTAKEDRDMEEDVFLFVDQTTSILRRTSKSVYEDIISQTIAQYELYLMFQCIHSIRPKSRATVLTLRAYPPEFLQTWLDVFGTPLTYIRGQGSLDAHLNYALKAQSEVSKVRGVLLYCSQMGVRDFGDVPIFSVENNTRTLLEWNQTGSIDSWMEMATQNIMVELERFTSAVYVSPFHTDPEWKQRGDSNFQDSLAFMSGRCFASNMLQPLMIHCHREPRIANFFAMVLCISSSTDMFDLDVWNSGIKGRQTLFRLRDNKTLRCVTYGDAFSALLRESLVCIGLYRRFHSTEKLPANTRFFITNPPSNAALLADDIIYCLDADAGLSVGSGSTS